MPKIQAGTDPNIPYHQSSFWMWGLVNVTVPIIAILFLDWNILNVLWLFYWELICWGGVGVIKILTASGTSTMMEQITTRIGALLFFTILYVALLMIVVSFSLVEVDFEDVGSNGGPLGVAFITIAANYLYQFYQSELKTGYWTIRHPYEVVFERIFFVLPFACLILFAVIPIHERFGGGGKVLAIGIVLVKFLMDIAVHYAPGLLIRFTEEEEEEKSEA